MAPALEILRAKKSDLFKAEGSKSIQGVIDILNKTDGHIASYIGTEVQDPDFWYAIIIWESVAHHQALIDNKELYPILVQTLSQGAAKVEFMYHALLSTSTPETALDAPLTEVLFWNLKEGTDKEEFKKLEDEFATKVLPSDAVKNRGGFGPVAEDERKISVVLGWDSIEDFKKTIATPWASEYIGKLKALADLDLKHVEFKKETSKA